MSKDMLIIPFHTSKCITFYKKLLPHFFDIHPYNCDNHNMNISVCMIMKNEEQNIEKCLDSIKDYGFEIILVDTGSSDDTVMLARKYTDKIYSFEWTDDFSAARTYSLSKASNDWVLILDCDEVVTSLDVNALKAITMLPSQCIGIIKRRNHFESNGTDSVYTDSVERFINKKALHYEGRIHELVRPLRNFEMPLCGAIHDTKIVCEHSGYNGTPDEILSKCQRNEKLLLVELDERPNDPYLYFQLGQCFNNIDDEKALSYYSRALEFDLDPELEYVQMSVIAYGNVLIRLGRPDEALGLLGVYDEFCQSADFICMIGLAYMRNGEYIKAMGEFLKATLCGVAHNEGSNSYIPLYNMGFINEMMGDSKTACLYYHKCGDFKPATDRLKELEP